MPLSLADHLALIEEEFSRAEAAPQSARKALLVAALIDNFPDRMFAAFRARPARVLGTEDLPAYRNALRAESPALGLVFDLCAPRPEAPRLLIGPVEVPIADYPGLSVEDYMVSLYNGHTVQRVLLVAPGEPPRLAHEVLAEAIAGLRATVR